MSWLQETNASYSRGRSLQRTRRQRCSRCLDTEDDFKYDEDGNRIEDEEEEEKASRIELGLASSKNALTMLKVQGQSSIINQMNRQTDIAMYYNTKINGGVYADVNSIADEAITR